MRRCPLVAVAVIGLLAPAAAGAAHVTVSGGAPATISVCGAEHSVALLDPEGVAKLRVQGRGRRRPGKLILQSCSNGKWSGKQRVGRRGGTVSEHIGDFRVRTTGKRKAKPVFLRFGVGEIVDAAFDVDVKNVNTTAVPCVPDGATRTLHGHLTAPRAALIESEPAVTLYVHGFAVSESFWRFRAVPGYDTTMQLAEAGHASVTIDRAGYESSKSAVDGTSTCIGSHADMAHQVIDALKAGRYNVEDNAAVSFARAALVGHSVGGLIAELAGGSFDGIDGIGIISYADQGQTTLAITELSQQSLRCGTGGDKATPGYALFGATDAVFQRAFLNAPTDPDAFNAATKSHVPEPCGDVLSAAPALVAAQTIGATLTGPVLLLSGESDALFTPTGVQLQRDKLVASNDTVTTELIPDTGHALTIGRSAPTVVDALESWLTTNNF